MDEDNGILSCILSIELNKNNAKHNNTFQLIKR